MTIRSSPDPHILGLQCLAAVLADDALAHRFVDLTGISPARLRSEADQPWVTQAVFAFLAGHEPTLLRIAAILQIDASLLTEAANQTDEGNASCDRS